jgi:arylsulfatase A-like enzyme
MAVATGAVIAMALIELLATMVDYSGPVQVVALIRLVPLDLTLWAFVWVPAVVLTGAAFVVPRGLVSLTRGRDEARAMAGPAAHPVSPRTVTRIFALILCAVVFVLWSSRTTFVAFEKYKEHRLAAILLALEQVVAIGVLALIFVGLTYIFDLARTGLDRVLSRMRFLNLFGNLATLSVFAAGGLVAAIAVEVHRHAYMRPLVPWRWMVDGGAALIGAAIALAVLRRRPHLLPVDRVRRRKVARIGAGAALAVVPLTLLWIGGDADTKGVAISASPALEKMIGAVRWANDLDRDGFGSLLGENDCAPFDRKIHPGARDLPDDGIDQNCNGHDSSLRDLVAPVGEKRPVPEAFQRDWNVLLITIDTVRYDHTTFGGYEHDTTPRLAELVDRAVSFDFAVAPSAGTMASVPAILTSKFFHSGIALDEKRKKGMPPILKPENTTLPEVMKRGHYTTGAILSHEYFNAWGMEQGVDEYDNTIGKKPDADRVSSDQSTARALAWITRHGQQKWFLWVHYLDPHGHYVPHPDGPQYGISDTEMEHYDEEIHYTDQYLGKLFDDLARTGVADRTIVIITSDHGDAFMEHNTRNHGDTLYRELLHVPLIVVVPDLPPRRIEGAVTPLDILPTCADLAGIDVSDLSFEGRSLVPQIFYGHEDPERVVFAETNFPHVLRAAVSQDYKLIYDLKNNQYKLFDLQADPWEKKDVSSKQSEAFGHMKEQLQAWIDRVVFARDADANQVLTKLQGILLDKEPTPAHLVEGVSFDDGAIEVIGWDTDPPGGKAKPGSKLAVAISFRVKKRPSGPFKLQAQVWQCSKSARSGLRTTAEGFLPTNQWQPGDFIRDRFEISIPADWAHQPGDLSVGLLMQGEEGKVTIAGPTQTGDASAAVLGPLGIEAPPDPVQIPNQDAGVPSRGGSAPPRP